MENLCLKVNYFKKKLKLTNMQISKLANLPVATVERIASGRTKNPNLKTLKAMAAVFECSLDELMNLQDMTKPYYLDEQTAEIAQKIYNDESLKALYSAVQTLSFENLQAVIGLAERLNILQEQNLYLKNK